MRSLLLPFVLPFVIACGSSPAPPPLTASKARPAFAEIKGAAELLQPGALIVIGEMHGTEEFPALVGDLAEASVRAGRAVSVHLEMPREEQALVEQLLSGTASREPPRDAVWGSAYQDGRRSRAVWQLLLRLANLARDKGPVQIARAHASLRSQGPVHVQCFDPGNTPGASGFNQPRDRGMAEAVIEEVKARPGDVHLVLVGNVHSRTEHGLPWDATADYDPFARLVKASGAKLTTILGRFSGGTYWGCSSDRPSSCGPKQVGPQKEGAGGERELRLEGGLDGGYAGVAIVGELHASPPAAGAP